MSATYTPIARDKWQITICHPPRQRVRVVIKGPEHRAQAYVDNVHKRETLDGANMVAVILAEKAAKRAATPVATPASFPTLRAALGAWLDRAATSGDLRQSTARHYRGACAKWLDPTLGDTPIDQVSREQIGAVIQAIKGAGHGLSLIKMLTNPLRGFFREQIETKALTVNPTERLTFFVGKGAHQKAQARAKLAASKFYTLEEQQRLLAAAEQVCPRWRAFLMTGLFAGLRYGEGMAIMRDDVDWKRGRIHVQRTLSKPNRIEPCKSGKDRWVKASAGLLAALRKQMELVDLDGAALDWTAEQKAYLFPNGAGTPGMTSGWFYRDVWKPLIKAAGVKRLPYHATRHSFATTILNEDGRKLQWVSEQLGHSSIELTAGIYGHLIESTHEDAVRVFDQILAAN